MPKDHPKKKSRARTPRLKPLNGALLDINTAAAYFGTTPWAVRRWAERGHVPSLRIGGRIVFRRTSIEAHLQKMERERTKELATGGEAA